MKIITIKASNYIAMPGSEKLVTGVLTVENSSYWRARIKDGSVTLVKENKEVKDNIKNKNNPVQNYLKNNKEKKTIGEDNGN